MANRLTGQDRRDLYRSIRAANPAASKDEIRALYRAALRQQREAM